LPGTEEYTFAGESGREATVTGPTATADIFEKRHKYYADGVGLVSSTWSYSYDHNDPQGTYYAAVQA